MNSDQYSQHIEHLNDAAGTSLLIVLGNRLGLFQVMMKENRPVTSQELADITGMRERYVREWLHGVAIGRLVQYDADNKTFHIPAYHHDALIWHSSWSVWTELFASRTRHVENHFRMNNSSEKASDDLDFDTLCTSTLRQTRLKSSKLFFDKHLMAHLSKSNVLGKFESGVKVLDVCCGSGELTLEFAKRFPASTFTGLDLDESPLVKARELAEHLKAKPASFIQGDVQNLPDTMTNTYDVVLMIEALHNLPDPHKALSQVHRVLKKCGHLILLEPGPSSDIVDNIGNLQVSRLCSSSIHYCLPTSLSSDPRIGFGGCWGWQNMESAVKEHFVISELYLLDVMLYRLYLCTKLGGPPVAEGAKQRAWNPNVSLRVGSNPGNGDIGFMRESFLVDLPWAGGSTLV